ncbi:unnamed protein product [Caenorhabditis bovis]|uniref:Uncharacterized protein n=1 Tax=Caenorhabditis bovis TaxID=2654633 RepID=A0A8S1EJQ3_9PELO|nr:unnamed protein product [Caenorhabditis bovis]
MKEIPDYIKNECVFVLKANEYDKKLAKKPNEAQAINYYVESGDESDDESELIENRAIRTRARFDEEFITKQNFKAWIGERMVRKEKNEKTGKIETQLRRRFSTIPAKK